jgi:hypothetical protein
MTRIKIVGALVFTLSIILAVLSAYISNKNITNTKIINSINSQKEFTQEISKTIFYIYKNSNSSYEVLDDYIKNYYIKMKNQETYLDLNHYSDIEQVNKNILKQWNEFYLYVQNFRDNIKFKSTYSGIVSEKILNKIYNKNLMLIVEFNKLKKLYKKYFNKEIDRYKYIQSGLFILLFILLIYLFTQIKLIILFIQKFSSTSQKIINKSTIKDLKKIDINNESAEILEATNNFNFIVNNINNAIKTSTISMEHSYKSLENVENSIEQLMELLYAMDKDGEIDKNLTKKEDIIIQSLEEITISIKNLQQLKSNLKNLISEN